MKNSAELSKTYKNEILTINLLLATDKYLLHLRKIKNSKAEAIKISIATATARDRKNSQDESGKTIEKSAKSVKIDSKLKKTSTQPPVVNSEPVASNESQKENQKENEENIESPQCKFFLIDFDSNIIVLINFFLKKSTNSTRSFKRRRPSFKYCI